MMADKVTKKRIAIYTRKSVEDGLEQEFNSLDAQREAGEAYIVSQKANGWVCLPKRYDDGGYTGGNIERPALQQLLKDCEAGLVDVIVVYKIDRLSRSICDFSELMKKFDEWNVQFVAVTQEINTATSAGRMMLNILMSFSQYERELISERTKDKMGASRKKGMWVGGIVVLGYKVENKKLVVVPEEAEVVRRIFQRYIEVQSPKLIAAELNRAGVTTKRGRKWNTAGVYRTLTNHTYVGEVNYLGKMICEGEHQSIVGLDVWNRVQAIMQDNNPIKAPMTRARIESPLRGILKCGNCDCAMMPTYGRKNGKKYFYYVCSKDAKSAERLCPVRSLSAGVIEGMVREQLQKILSAPDIIIILAQASGLTAENIAMLFKDVFWKELSPGEYARLFQLLLEKVTAYEDHVEIELRTKGLKNIAEEFSEHGKE